MDKEELKKFLAWLEKEGIARWYYIDEESGGEGVENLITRYLNDKGKQ
jgi:hypothetical protein